MKKYSIDFQKFDLNKILETYNKFKDVELKDINPNDLPDIKDLKFDYNLSSEERILSYLEQGYHPYVVKVGNYLVGMKFSDDGPSLEEIIEKIIDRKLSNYVEKH